MNNILTHSPAALCVGCLSSNRDLRRINDDESEQMFRGFLDELEFKNDIRVCYECNRRLLNAVHFKRQVQQANMYLLSTTESNKSLVSLSKLHVTKMELFDLKSTEESRAHKHRKKKPKKPKPDSDTITYFNNMDILNTKNGVNELSDANDEKLTLTRDVKDELLNEVKNEPLENKIEQVMLEVNYNDSFNESDEEPLHKIKIEKDKKEKKARKRRQVSPGVVRAPWVTHKLAALNVPPGCIDVVVLTPEQVEEERQKVLQSSRYLQQQYHCTDCAVGFGHRSKLEKHMLKHAPEAGEFECESCKSRFKTHSALLCHKRRHRTRWRCGACGALYSRAGVAADHRARAHRAAAPAHRCRHCGLTLHSLSKLRAHLRTHAQKQHCELCGKLFPDRASLRTHLFIHTGQKDFSCERCDKRFRFKKALEIHRLSHEPSQLLYCTECDMNFKNQISFYHHMKYSMKHIHPDKIKHACEFCPRRFSKPSRLQEHRLSIHLKLAPHRCTAEGCTFASASRPALRTHIRMVHKNKRLERNHVCHTCGKAYTSRHTLAGHLRAHAGRRALACARCPAAFAHAAALYNHNRLVHKVPFVRRRKPDWTQTSTTT